MKYIVSYLLVLCMLFSALSCGRDDVQVEDSLANDASILRARFLEKAEQVSAGEGEITFPNGNGEMITLPLEPQSTVILYASLTTLWYEAGGTVSGCIGGNAAIELYQNQIGRDITQDASVSVVADSPAAGRWGIERILAQRPDLIVCSEAMNGYATIEGPARAAGIPVVLMDYRDFSDYLKWFKVSCYVSGHPDLWETVAMPALNEVVEILLSCEPANSPRVFSMFTGVDSLKANTEHTVIGGMLGEMGASNVAAGWGGSAEHMEVSLEAVYAADPDLILIQCHTGLDDAKALVARLYGEHPVWQSLRAVREGRVYYLDKALFHNKPNSRFSEAYAVLKEYLYPNG